MWCVTRLSTNNFKFYDQICPKRVFLVENRKRENHHWILHFRISLGIKFQFQLKFLTFWTKKKYPFSVFRVENRKTEPHYCILDIQFTVSTKFQFPQTIPNFYTKFSQKRYFSFKNEKLSMNIKIWIIELFWIPSFTLNK